jgi:hypothetical protein
MTGRAALESSFLEVRNRHGVDARQFYMFFTLNGRRGKWAMGIGLLLVIFGKALED